MTGHFLDWLVLVDGSAILTENTPGDLMPLTKREKRVRDFASFSKGAKAAFFALARAQPRHEFFQKEYMLCVTPGGRLGGFDHRRVEVFYGQRAFDHRKEINEHGKIQTQLLSERGATLTYERTDDGKVIASLMPASSEGRIRKEDAIFLGRPFDPAQLRINRSKLGRDWQAFFAYMECTSLDGEPTLLQSAQIMWLQFSKHRLVDGKVRDPRLYGWAMAVFRIVKKFAEHRWLPKSEKPELGKGSHEK